jgi:hypothetical protein
MKLGKSKAKCNCKKLK